jgi:hypothetical protein
MAMEFSAEYRLTIDSYKRALKFIDECGDITYDKLKEAYKIANIDIPESELQARWSQIERGATFEAVTERPAVLKKKWWHFVGIKNR